MTKRFTVLSLFLFLFSAAFSQGYKITVKIKGLKSNSTCLLANYYADKNQLKDSAKTDANGVMVFKGKEILPNGIYLVVTPSRNYFEIVVSKAEQEFTIETDTNFETEKFVIKNSRENKAFFEFNNFASSKSMEFETLKARLSIAKNRKDSMAINKQIVDIDSFIQVKRQEIADREPDLFISKVFRSFKELPEPVPVRNADGSLQDSNYRYNYYKDQIGRAHV